MTWNHVLLWMPLAACAAGAVGNVQARVPLRDPSWLALLAVAAVAGLGAALAPGWAGWATAGVFTAGLLVPNVLQRLANWAVRRGSYAAAAQVARVARVAAPHLGGLAGANGRLLDALALAVRGRMPAAEAALDGLRRDGAAPAAVRTSAAAHLCRLRGDWSLVLAGPEPPPGADPAGAIVHLRALQETGQRAAMLALFARHRGGFGDHEAAAALMVLAAYGRAAGVARLLGGPMSVLARRGRAYWRARAALAGGDLAGAAALRDLADGADRLLALAARQCLDAPMPAPPSAAERAAVDGIEASAPAGPGPWIGDAPVTLALVALNLLAFGAEVLAGGASDEDVLFRLGGLWPEATASGDWWRLGTALFLHLGVLHLLLNMLALLALGLRLERASGPWALLAAYSVAGVASTGGVLALAWAGVLADEALVGASGAIMGLLGAILAATVLHWRRDRSAAALRGAVLLGATVALQAGFDLLTPEVSLAAHLCGLAAGTGVGLAWRGALPAGAGLRRARVQALGVLAVGAGALAAAAWRFG